MADIIITIQDEARRFEYDLQVPDDVEGRDLLDDIVESLNSYNPDLLLRVQQCRISIPRLDMYQMGDDDTLAGIGVFDGDYLILNRQRK